MLWYGTYQWFSLCRYCVVGLCCIILYCMYYGGITLSNSCLGFARRIFFATIYSIRFAQLFIGSVKYHLIINCWIHNGQVLASLFSYRSRNQWVYYLLHLRGSRRMDSETCKQYFFGQHVKPIQRRRTIQGCNWELCENSHWKIIWLISPLMYSVSKALLGLAKVKTEPYIYL